MRMQVSSVGGDIQSHEKSIIRWLFDFLASLAGFMSERVHELPGEGTIINYNKITLPLNAHRHGALMQSVRPDRMVYIW